ncbi:MAG: DUF4918 family protein [Bacteroidia bacterium]|nr:DUF4918 family protein [Bacteroidia bacterium]
MATFAEKVISFCKELEYKGSLPPGISIMNPFRDNPQIIPVISQFYNKFYNDDKSRHLILGINPGRFGAGVTGIPFTDTKRLTEKCGLSIHGLETFETSSVFVYEMIDAFGGTRKFFNKFFISAVSPLGFTSVNANGRAINYNYYDSKKLTDAVLDFIIESLTRQLEFCIERNTCFCLGTGQNYKFLVLLNNKLKIFNKIIPLEHPRYIMQYKSKQKLSFINKYIEEFRRI